MGALFRVLQECGVDAIALGNDMDLSLFNCALGTLVRDETRIPASLGCCVRHCACVCVWGGGGCNLKFEMLFCKLPICACR